MTSVASSVSSTRTYHSVEIEGVDIFYQEAGSKDVPSLDPDR